MLDRKLIDLPFFVKPSGGGGVDLNIAYGDTAPADTTKLWVISDKPSEYEFTRESAAVEEMTVLYDPLPSYGGGCPAITVGTNIYVFGTAFSSNLHIFKLDTLTGLSTTLTAVCPFSCNQGTCCYKNGLIYVASAQGIFSYDVAEDTVTTIHTGNVYNLSSTYTGGAIYNDKFVWAFEARNGSSYSSMFMATMDLSDNTITFKIINATNSTGGAVAVLVGNSYYLFGSSTSSNSKRIYVYNILQDTISRLGVDLISATSPYGSTNRAVAFQDNIYIFNKGTTDKFNITSNTVTALPAWTPIGVTDWALCGTSIYGFASGAGDGTNSSVIKRFMITVSLNTGKLLFCTREQSHWWNILSNPICPYPIDSVLKGNSSNIAESVEACLYNTTTSQWEAI